MWSARKLLNAVGYARPEHFMIAIRRAASACKDAGENTAAHFIPVTLVKPAGELSVQVVRDFKLTRSACRLLMMTAVSRRKSVVSAESYFAPVAPAKTRRIKLPPADSGHPPKPSGNVPKPAPNSWRTGWLDGKAVEAARAKSRFIPAPDDKDGNWRANRKASWNPNLAVNRGYHNGAASNSR